MISDFSYECDSREAFDAWMVARSILVPVRVDPVAYDLAEGYMVDWIGPIMIADDPPAFTPHSYVNLRYVGDVEALVQRLVLDTDPAVRWIDPNTITNYPRVWAGGMQPYGKTDEQG